MFSPWKILSAWAPFKIDALGLLTLLGADEVNISVGRLAHSCWLEYMPLLAGYVFAADRFRAKQPGFTLYNVTSGIVTGNLAAWFTRWMQVQNFHVSRSVVYWEVTKTVRTRWSYCLVPAFISAIFTGFLLVLTILSEDWYGCANAIAIIALILVRSYMIQESRNAISRVVAAAEPFPMTFTNALVEWNEKRKKDPKVPQPQPDSREWRPEVVKIIVIMPDSRAVTMFIPEHLLRGAFVTETPVQFPTLYRLAEWIGWIAFTVHVVTLGMAQLATQLYVIVITVIPTVLTCYGFGCDDSRLYKGWRWLLGADAGPYVYNAGPHLKATVFEWPEDVEFTRDKKGIIHRRAPLPIPADKRSTARQDLYAWLNLSDEEQKSLWDWHLLPHKRGHDESWWNNFNEKKRLIRERPPNMYGLKVRIQCELEATRARHGLLRRWLKVLGDVEKASK